MGYEAPMVQTVDYDNVDSGLSAQVEDQQTIALYRQLNYKEAVQQVPIMEKTGGYTVSRVNWHRGWSQQEVDQPVIHMPTYYQAPDVQAALLSWDESINASRVPQQQVPNKLLQPMRAPGINEGQ